MIKLASGWEEMLNMLLEAEPLLSLEDIDFIEGEDEELVRKLAQKLNRNSEQITGWIESVSSIANFLHSLPPVRRILLKLFHTNSY